MQPEETDPGLLVGRHVVEVGVRQGLPFLTFADSRTGREVRIYIDSSVRVSPGSTTLLQDDERLLPLLEQLDMMTVDSAMVVEGNLELALEGRKLWVCGDDNTLTTHVPWWVGLQRSGEPELGDGDEAAAERLGQLLRDDVKPADFVYPPEFLRLVAKGLLDLEPWEVFLGPELHRRLFGLAKRYHQRLVPFARRTDNDDVACWDLDLPTRQVLVVHDWASPGWERRDVFPNFGTWLRQAVDDFVVLGEIEGDFSG